MGQHVRSHKSSQERRLRKRKILAGIYLIGMLDWKTQSHWFDCSWRYNEKRSCLEQRTRLINEANLQQSGNNWELINLFTIRRATRNSLKLKRASVTMSPSGISCQLEINLIGSGEKQPWAIKRARINTLSSLKSNRDEYWITSSPAHTPKLI